MEEIWKDIEGYEGLYQVSNLGRVKTIEREDVVGNRWGTKTTRIVKGRILKPVLNKDGYYLCSLHKDGKGRNYLIHRLVAFAFMPNPYNLPQVNHKSEVRTENFVGNLEWCDAEYNCKYGFAPIRRKEKRIKPVIGFDMEHKLGVYFPSATAAEFYFSGKKTGMIKKVLTGNCLTGYGYRWEYV